MAAFVRRTIMRMITKALAWLIAIGIGLLPVVAHARSTGANDGCSLPAQTSAKHLPGQPTSPKIILKRGKG
jgi:hypothetical protein